MDTQIQQKIVESLQHLDSFQLSEVSDFVEFIHRKRKTILADPNIIDALCGKYRDRLSSSKEFAEKKQEEIKIEEEKWQIPLS
jgi:hypothetical protein